QPHVTEPLRLFLRAAVERGEPLEHVLLWGPPGLGKTTLASILAHETGKKLHVVAAPNLEKKSDVASILSRLEPGDVFFIDEIHRLQPPIEELLYSAMEDFRIDLILASGSTSARTVSMDVCPFTLVGATTRPGMLTQPMRDRFGLAFALEWYSEADLISILARSAALLRIDLAPEAAKLIAHRSRGTPRVANALLRRARDLAQVERLYETGGEPPPGLLEVREEAAEEALTLLRIDSLGLGPTDRKILYALRALFGPRPVGLTTLAQCIGEDRGTLESVHEPHLMRCGLIVRTPRGRCLTEKGLAHLRALQAAFDTGAIRVRNSRSTG
ncbi:MAG TPA: Holliday junction branch migration DNA helicase RuvB, partial [Bdellovibrionota bacterium]|nr:Holliday junction branch migration DNA helicase RuvB [Bdellovibrionota bacterium]